jgi:transcriptional regulator with XRE-family HTH domain
MNTNNLREMRKNSGMRQIDVAALIGHVNPDRISNWEKGFAFPSVMNLFRLSAIYGVAPEQLYTELQISISQEISRVRFESPTGSTEKQHAENLI